MYDVLSNNLDSGIWYSQQCHFGGYYALGNPFTQRRYCNPVVEQSWLPLVGRSSMAWSLIFAEAKELLPNYFTLGYRVAAILKLFTPEASAELGVPRLEFQCLLSGRYLLGLTSTYKWFDS